MQLFSRARRLAVATALAAFASPPAQAILGGTVDTAHTAVVMVLNEGDDGGPAIALVSSRPTVIGTSSYGDASCANFASFQRTDAESAFIETYAPEPGVAALAATALAAAARRRG
jgi:hypothetical protein